MLESARSGPTTFVFRDHACILQNGRQFQDQDLSWLVTSFLYYSL